MLTPEQVEQYQRDGFFVLEGFTPPEEVAAMRQRGIDLVSGYEPVNTATFSTSKQNNTTDDYFLESANNVSFFFEDGAFGPDGKLIRPKELSVNKLGHALHDVDAVFKAWARSEKFASVLRSLGYQRPLPVQASVRPLHALTFSHGYCIFRRAAVCSIQLRD